MTISFSVCVSMWRSLVDPGEELLERLRAGIRS